MTNIPRMLTSDSMPPCCCRGSAILRPEPDYTAVGPIPEAELTALAGTLLEGRKSRGLLPLRPFSFEMNFHDPEPSSAQLSRERRLFGLFKCGRSSPTWIRTSSTPRSTGPRLSGNGYPK